MNNRIAIVITLIASALVTSCSRQQPQAEATAPAGPADTVNLTSAARNRFDISVVTVQERPFTEMIVTTGEIKADENRVFHLNSLANGRVISDRVVLGDVIRAGQTLGIVQNTDVAKIYGDYIHQAHQNEIDIKLEETRLALNKKNYDRIKGLYDEGIAAAKDYIKAEADKKLSEQTLSGLKEHRGHIREEAKAMLTAYGVALGESTSERIESTSPITTPRGGVIIKKNVTVGDVVNSIEPLYVVADLSQVWLDIAIYDKQLQTVKVGDSVTFTSDSLPGRTITGQINYIKPSTEATSGTFVARAVVENRDMLLKPGMLGQVKIQSPSTSKSPFVPEDAVQKYGKESFVFVDAGNGSYRRRNIALGERVEGGYFITHGVKAGDRIVGKGSFTLKAEMLKSTMPGED